MKSTETFKKTIQEYLENRAASDALFSEKFKNEEKNIDDCITYILNEVKNSGCNGFADDEIFSMAVHYYDEENIESGEDVKCNVVVNHVVEITEEDKENAKKAALQKLQDEAYKKLTEKKSVKKEKTTIDQPSLFFDEDETEN